MIDQHGLVKFVLNNGGSIHPLILPAKDTNGTGTFNPSIYNDNGKLLMNIRHCQVTIYHSERNKFEHEWGPLSYLNPENDITLTTTNFFCELDSNLNITKHTKVDFSKFDVPPLWEFRGLEDGRVIRWDGKLYLCGVRRDTTTNGVGRMELSEIEITHNAVKEVSRYRIPTPGNIETYCEKNWMPIVDQPFHYVKWCNPTEVVKVDPENNATTQVFHGSFASRNFDIRGGSHVIPIGDHYVALCHESRLFKSEQGRKNAVYRHLFVVWDKNWNVVRYTEPVSFMNTWIEFAAGMCEYKGDILISFGIQDNAAFLLRVPMNTFTKIVGL